MLGHYRVDERIGAGGMGVVYRAYDTRLERPVAIKLVKDPGISSDAAHKHLIAEARMASALNHPNICTVYEVGEGDGCVFLAMEYVDGKRLDALLAGGGLPADTVIRHGTAMAAALEHAHAHGVLHRDLKTANVIVTPTGTAKILDFGIAKRANSTADEVTRPASGPDTAGIVGTLAYLAPEILAGLPADVRSDIWSLGVLLYELAAGRRPFTGRSTFELTAAILHETAAPLPGSVPPALRAIILRCLNKEPEQRYSRAGEVRAALEAIGAGTSVAAVEDKEGRRRTWAAIGIVTTGLVGALFVAAWWPDGGTDGRPGPGTNRLTAVLSSEHRIVDPALSPDGSMIAFVGEDDAGQRDLYLSQVAGGGRIQLTNDPAPEGWPRFSPDGQRIVFTRREAGVPSLYLIDTLGGIATRVLESASEASWSPDGTRLAFVYRPEGEQASALATALIDGSNIRVLYTAEPAYPFVRNTAWSADGLQIAFGRSAGGSASEIWIVPADGGMPTRLSEQPIGVFNAEPVFTPDGRHVILSSNRGGATNLWAIPLDGGTPTQLTTGPGPDASPSIAENGMVAFLNSRWRSGLIVTDTSRGESRTLLTHWPYLWSPALSPDGTTVAFSRAETGGLWHIWTVPSGGGSARQITSSETGELYPRYTPDGSAIVYHSWGEPHRIWKVALAGGPPEPITPEGAANEAWADPSPDGRELAFVQVTDGVEHLYVASIDHRNARRLTTTTATTPRWSPDGTQIVFARDRSYQGGIVIIGADGSNERLLSAVGGWPVWRPDGKAVVFLVVGARGDQEVRMVDLSGRPIVDRVWPRFVGTNHLIEIFANGSSIVTTSAVHLSDEVWLLGR